MDSRNEVKTITNRNNMKLNNKRQKKTHLKIDKNKK